MGGGLRRLRSGTKRVNLSFRNRVRNAVATRIAGAAAVTAGVALMGFATVGSPVVSGGGAAVAATLTSVTSITLNLSCTADTASGTVTLSNPVDGETLTLEVYSHIPGSGAFVPTGATGTLTPSITADNTTYSYLIHFTPVTGANAYLVAAVGGTPTDAWDSSATNAKSLSYTCSEGTTTTTTTAGSTTTTTTPTTTTTTTSAGSSTSSTSSTTTSSGTTTTAGSVPGTTTTSKTTTAAAGVLGVSTSTPSTGANIAFGVGLGLLVLGGLLFSGRSLIGRGKRRK